MRQQEEMKHSILSQILDQNARARRKPFAFDLHFVILTSFFLLFYDSKHFKDKQTRKSATRRRSTPANGSVWSVARQGKIFSSWYFDNAQKKKKK